MIKIDYNRNKIWFKDLEGKIVNGHVVFTVDATSLTSHEEIYEVGKGLNTLSEIFTFIGGVVIREDNKPGISIDIPLATFFENVTKNLIEASASTLLLDKVIAYLELSVDRIFADGKHCTRGYTHEEAKGRLEEAKEDIGLLPEVVDNLFGAAATYELISILIEIDKEEC